MKTKFTTPEIKEWLEGWFVAGQYEDGRRKGLSLESILVLLECYQDGIEAYFERKEEEFKRDKYDSFVNHIKSMSIEEKFQSLVDAGIYTQDGELAENYK